MAFTLSGDASVHFRNATTADIPGIIAVVDRCGPYLSRHIPYLYLIYSRYFNETCAVAVIDQVVVGWCSILPIGDGRYFLHQLGIAPQARRHGIAFALLCHQLRKLHERHGDVFHVEFTVDAANEHVQRMNRRVAATLGLTLRKLPDAVPPLEDGSCEELYEMRASDEVGAFGTAA